MGQDSIPDDTVIIAHTADRLKRAFFDWDRAREWEDAVDTNYTLTEVLVVDE